jgi:hypothetical protein
MTMKAVKIVRIAEKKEEDSSGRGNLAFDLVPTFV